MIEEMHTRHEQPLAPVHRPQFKVLPGHVKMSIRLRLINGMLKVLNGAL